MIKIDIMLITMEMIYMDNYKDLSDSLLIEAYKEAKRLALSEDFIKLLEEEITYRNLQDKL